MTKGRGEASAPHANEADPAEGKEAKNTIRLFLEYLTLKIMVLNYFFVTFATL